MIVVPIILAVGAAATIAILATWDKKAVPDHQPDLPPAQGSTRYKRVNAILGELKKASQSSGIPLGVLVGWVAKESGGRLNDITRLDERGYFQLMPAESKTLGLDHQRLSTDSTYSINAGLALIGRYMGLVSALGVAPPRSPYFWKLVKLFHSMGSGATPKLVAMAKAAGQVGSWEDFSKFALTANVKGPQPKKWVPYVQEIHDVGKPFGFGETGESVVGGAPHPYPDIPDPLECA